MIITREVEVQEEIDIDISIKEIYDNMTQDEVIEMHRLCDAEVRDFDYCNKNYYLQSFFVNKTDSEILNSTELLSKLAYFLKYEDNTLLEFMKEELL